MNAKQRTFHSPFLPVGIAMALMSVAVTFGAGEVHWLWQAEPHVALLLVVVGVAFIVTHFIQRARARTRS